MQTRIPTTVTILLLLLSSPTVLPAQQDFLRGDVDGNGLVEPLVDFYAFTGGWDFVAGTLPTDCEDAADVNDDGVLEIQDALALLGSWWGAGTFAPPAPGVLICGPDPTADALGCAVYDCVPDPPPPALPGASLSIAAVTGTILDEIAAPVVLDHTVPISGFSFAVCHDPNLLELIQIDFGADLPLVNPATEYRNVDIAAGNWEVAFTAGRFPNQEIPPGVRELYRPIYRLVGAGSGSFSFCTTTGVIPMPPRAYTNAQGAFSIATVEGTIDGVAGPIPEDDCANALVIDSGETVFTTGGTTSAGPALGASCTLPSIENDIWLRYPVPCTGEVTITVESSAFTPRLAVYSTPNCPAVLSELLDCGEATVAPGPASITRVVPVQSGQVLSIRIGSDGTASGVGTVFVSCAEPPVYTSVGDLLAPAPQVDGNFGYAIGMSETWLAIAEVADSTLFDSAGSVHLYEKVGDDWVDRQTLTHPAPAPLLRFGSKIAFDGETLVVGMQTQLGLNFVFTYILSGSTWALDEVVPASAGGGGGSYGNSIAIREDLLVVANEISQTVFVYRHTGAWTVEATLFPTLPQGLQFGWDVAISNDGQRILVGDLGAIQARGRAHLFEFDGALWNEIALLTASDGEPGDRFGSSVTFLDDGIAIGAPNSDDACPNTTPCNSGAVYVFQEDLSGAWLEVAKLQEPFPAPLRGFGSTVLPLPGNEFVVQDGGGATFAGGAHLFRPATGGGWEEAQAITATPSVDGAIFGFAMAASAGQLAIGAIDDPAGGAGAGRVEIFERSLLPVGVEFERGDCNQDATRNIADAVYTLSVLFPTPGNPVAVNCADACDANDDGSLNIADAIATLGSLFGSPAVPLPPPVSCGLDPTVDPIGCAIAGGACP